jgi:flagellar biosynthesis/type III secretory pathway protein FliH
LQLVQNQAALLRRRAYNDGYAAGFAKSQAEAAKHILHFQRLAREFADTSENHLVRLASSTLMQIAYKLGEATVVPRLAVEALRSHKKSRSVRIHVTGAAAERTRAALAQWQQENPARDAAVLVDPQLAQFVCVLESEHGRIDSGLAARVEEFRNWLISGEAPAPDSPPAR